MMYSRLRSVHFILGDSDSMDTVRAAFDAADEITRRNSLSSIVCLPRSPFASRLASLYSVKPVWLKNFLPMIFRPIAISKTLSADGGHLIFTSGSRSEDFARMAAELAGCKDDAVVKPLPQLCFAYQPLLSPPVTAAEPTIIYFGEITPDSRLDVLIHALSEKENDKWKLKVAGTGTARIVMPLVRQAKSAGIESRILWMGDVDNLSPEISSSTVAYIPQSDSPKRITAAGCGIPVISSPEELSDLPLPGKYIPYSEIIRNIIEL